MKGRFHFVWAVYYMRYGFWLCLIPLTRALLSGGLISFWSVFQQDLIILVGMAFLSLYAWLTATWQLTEDCLEIHFGFIFHRRCSCRPCQLAACELRRSLPQRLLGACELELFLNSCHTKKSYRLILTYRQGVVLRDALFPLNRVKNGSADESVPYRPSGGDWLMLAALSTNLVTETALVLMTIRHIRQLLGQDLEQQAVSKLEQLLATMGLAVPAGISLVLSIVFFFTCCSLVISVLRTGGYQVARTDGYLLCQGGLYTQVEQRIRTDCIHCIDVRRGLLSRISGFDSVYVYAGGFSNQNTPLLFFRRKDTTLSRQLLPEMMHWHAKRRYAARSIWQYIWRLLIPFSLVTVLWLVALYMLPKAAPIMAVCIGICLFFLSFAVEAFFTEGYHYAGNGKFILAFGRGFTRHFVTVLPREVTAKVIYSSLSIQQDRGDLVLCCPAGIRLRVRGICKSKADSALQKMYQL